MKYPTKNELHVMASIDLRKIDIDELIEIKDVEIDETLSKEEKINSFIEQIKNPYCYRCGDVVVKVSFSGNTSMQEKMENYLKKL